MGRRRKNFRKTPSVTHRIGDSRVAEKSSSEETQVVERRKDILIPKAAIDVHSRLELPIVHSSTHHRASDDNDEEDTIELNFWPRFIFVSNLCLVCMEQSQKICELCSMVSYCTDEHRKQDWPKHRELCKVLTEICTVSGGLSLLSELNPNDYRIYRLKLIEIVECRLGRPFELWEKEILLYPRVCHDCRYFSKALKCCRACGIALYCENHDRRHEEWCREFQVFRRVLFLQHENGHVNPEIPDIFLKDPLCLPDDFDSLMAQLYDVSAYYRDMDCYTYCCLSHVSTVPLTTLYSVQISCQDWKAIDTLVIHVIGAEFQFECINLHVWEKLFLHFLPNLKRLKLMFIGPELRPPAVPLDLLSTVKICSACKSSGRGVNVSFHPGKFYHDFCRSKQFVKTESRVSL